MRRSMKNQRDEILFRFFKRELNILMEMADNEEIDLFFFDESGFNLEPNVPYAWTPIKKQSCLPAIKGNTHSVVGLLNLQKNSFQGNIYKGAANSDCVIQTIDELALTTKRKTIILLDNASIHKSKKVNEKRKEWERKNLFLQFIPAYSPELNYIEILWRMMKHYWIEFEKYTSMEELEQAIIHVLQNYGKEYTINFG